MTCDKRSFARKIVNIHQFSYQCREHRRKSHRERRREDISPLAFRRNFCSFTTALAAKFPALLHSLGAGGEISGHVPVFFPVLSHEDGAGGDMFGAATFPRRRRRYFRPCSRFFPGASSFRLHWRRYFRPCSRFFPAILHSSGTGGNISGTLTFRRRWRRYFRHSYIPTALAAIFPAMFPP